MSHRSRSSPSFARLRPLRFQLGSSELLGTGARVIRAAGPRARHLRDSPRPAQTARSGVERQTLRASHSSVVVGQGGLMSRDISGRGGIRTPETGVARLTVFKTVAFNRSATLPRVLRMLRARAAPLGSLYTGKLDSGRGGREAEGTRLLSEYGGQTPSRVRIPPSPSRSKCGLLVASQSQRHTLA